MDKKTIMFDAFKTQKTYKQILTEVYKALEEKDYNPTDQLVGYLISGDPSYITSYNNARTLIKGIDRDELIAEMLKEYRTIREVVGPLMLVEGVSGVKYNELVEIEQADGEKRQGKVLEIDGDKALVQLFESSNGLRIDNAKARFLGRSIELSVAPDMLGRVFDGMGNPKDGGPALIPEKRPFRVILPAEIAVEFSRTDYADAAMDRHPDAERLDPRTVRRVIREIREYGDLLI